MILILSVVTFADIGVAQPLRLIPTGSSAPTPPVSSLGAYENLGPGTLSCSQNGILFNESESDSTRRNLQSTYGTPPYTPELDSPNNLTADLPLPITFVWHTAKDADSYEIQISSRVNPDFWRHIDQSGITDTVFTPQGDNKPEGLSSGRKYFWHVRAWNKFGSSPWSPVRSFIVLSTLPGTANVYYPEDMQNDIALHLQLKWSYLDLWPFGSYAVELATDSSFHSILMQQDGFRDNWVEVYGLAPKTSYFWHVRATNMAGSSPWSDTWRFTTVGTPGPPQLLAPVNGSSLFGSDTVFRLIGVHDAGNYEIDFSLDVSFSNILHHVYSPRDTFYTNIKAPFSKIYWRARSVNTAGSSPWSSIWFFYTGHQDSTIVIHAPKVPDFDAYASLDQNYPNPFRDRTTIRFRISADGSHGALPVRVSIQDLLGRTVAVLVDEPFAAGEYRIPFSMQTVSGKWASGMYLCRMETPGGSVSRIMSIVR